MRSVDVKPLDLIKSEISEIIFDSLQCSIQNYISLIDEKPVSYRGDNTNTTSTGPLRRGKIGVIRKLKHRNKRKCLDWAVVHTLATAVFRVTVVCIR
jgi:hypothetical protein